MINMVHTWRCVGNNFALSVEVGLKSREVKIDELFQDGFTSFKGTLNATNSETCSKHFGFKFQGPPKVPPLRREICVRFRCRDARDNQDDSSVPTFYLPILEVQKLKSSVNRTHCESFLPDLPLSLQMRKRVNHKKEEYLIGLKLAHRKFKLKWKSMVAGRE